MHENTPAVKRWREKNKAKGLCQCGKPRREGKTKCQTCADNHRASERKLKFGLDRESHASLIESQCGRCAFCECEIDLCSHIDHCHETGRVRGILCRTCNIALGYYEKHILPIVDKVHAYLKPT